MWLRYRYPDLFDWFKHFIGFDEQAMEQLEKKEAMAMEDNRQPWSEIDFSTCKRYGPSYRALPANVRFGRWREWRERRGEERRVLIMSSSNSFTPSIVRQLAV
jgi:hypothetical protein